MAKAQDTAMTVTQYIDKYKDISIREMKLTGIPASITLAQGILESANGSSYLARYAHNHFGIKCKGDWKGKTINYSDDAPNECFRAYDKAEDSYRDHSNYLKNSKRYAFLFQLPRTDYKGWANGLKQGGYASNPGYPQLIINTIESWNLAQYDSMPADSQPDKNVKHTSDTANHGKHIIYNKIPAYRTVTGETYKGIARSNKMMGWQLYRYNDLHSRYLDTDIPPQPLPGTLLYLMPKKRTGSEPFHVVQPGESMYAVSQEYGIKLKKLYKKNLLEKGERMQPGDTVFLQTKRREPPAVLSKADIKKPIKPQPLATLAKDRAENTPVKTDSILIPKPKTITADTTTNPGYYTVQESETLYGIAQKLGTTVSELKIDNHLISDRLYKGQLLKTPGTIVLPTQTSLYQAPPKPTPTPAPLPTLIAAPKPAPTPLPKPAIAKTDSTLQPETYHIVQKGETLSGIALKYHLSVVKLKAINNKANDDLAAGEKLNLVASPVPDNTPPPETFHIVQKGETLSGIARKYHLTIDALRTINHISNDKISAGQKLMLKPE